MSRFTAIYLGVLGALFAAVAGGTVALFAATAPGDAGAKAAEEHAYDVVSWELRSLPQKWLYKIGAVFRSGSPLTDDEALRRYFELGPVVQRLEIEAPDSDDLAAARDERRELENRVEDIIEGRMTAVLEDQQLAMEMPIFSDLGIIFPPVDFELDAPPRVLAVSPRDRIQLKDSYLLTPGLDLAGVTLIEEDVERDGVLSARVFQTGGVATYPAVLSEFDSYRGLVETAFHEWVHQYLVFFPLGRSYFAGDDTRTINETVASIAGRELARAYFERYSDYKRHDSPPASTLDGDGGPEPDFDFFEEMRALRRQVEALLDEGLVEEAEALMASKRDEFEEHGYYVRKINQAYFAYRGFYATSSGSVDPLGSKLQEVYERSGSPGEFLRLVASVTTRDDVDELLG